MDNEFEDLFGMDEAKVLEIVREMTEFRHQMPLAAPERTDACAVAYQKAIKAMEENRFEEAVGLLLESEKAALIYSEFMDISQKLMECYLELGEVQDAFVYLLTHTKASGLAHDVLSKYWNSAMWCIFYAASGYAKFAQARFSEMQALMEKYESDLGSLEVLREMLRNADIQPEKLQNTHWWMIQCMHLMQGHEETQEMAYDENVIPGNPAYLFLSLDHQHQLQEIIKRYQEQKL